MICDAFNTKKIKSQILISLESLYFQIFFFSKMAFSLLGLGKICCTDSGVSFPECV